MELINCHLSQNLDKYNYSLSLPKEEKKNVTFSYIRIAIPFLPQKRKKKKIHFQSRGRGLVLFFSRYDRTKGLLGVWIIHHDLN